MYLSSVRNGLENQITTNFCRERPSEGLRPDFEASVLVAWMSFSVGANIFTTFSIEIAFP